MDDNIKTLVMKMIDLNIRGADKYVHKESTWLIFTESKKWVIELTKERTLWYNYYFFNDIFKVFNLDLIENQHIITEWVEETIINNDLKKKLN